MSDPPHSAGRPETAPAVVVVMGVSGSGKSTVGAVLARQLGVEFAEGDDMHPAANVVKMATGTPLTDEDREPWLERVANWIDDRIATGQGGVVACSALKRSYRDRIGQVGVVFAYLRGDRATIGNRLAHRSGHFMPATLLESQFSTLEEPGADEPSITVDISEFPTTAEQVAYLLGSLEGP